MLIDIVCVCVHIHPLINIHARIYVLVYLCVGVDDIHMHIHTHQMAPQMAPQWRPNHSPVPPPVVTEVPLVELQLQPIAARNRGSLRTSKNELETTQKKRHTNIAESPICATLASPTAPPEYRI